MRHSDQGSSLEPIQHPLLTRSLPALLSWYSLPVLADNLAATFEACNCCCLTPDLRPTSKSSLVGWFLASAPGYWLAPLLLAGELLSPSSGHQLKYPNRQGPSKATPARFRLAGCLPKKFLIVQPPWSKPDQSTMDRNLGPNPYTLLRVKAQPKRRFKLSLTLIMWKIPTFNPPFLV